MRIIGKLGERLLVHIDPETRLFRDTKVAAVENKAVAHQFLGQFIVRTRPDRFQDEEVRDRCGEVQIHDRGKRAIWVMRRHRDIVRLRQGGDLLHACETTAVDQVALQNIHRVLFDEFANSVDRCPALAGRNRDRRVFLHLGQHIRVLRWYWFLREYQAEVFERTAKPDGVLQVQPPVAIERETQFRPACLSRGNEILADALAPTVLEMIKP